jgi:hypothetical protein
MAITPVSEIARAKACSMAAKPLQLELVVLMMFSLIHIDVALVCELVSAKNSTNQAELGCEHVSRSDSVVECASSGWPLR